MRAGFAFKICSVYSTMGRKVERKTAHCGQLAKSNVLSKDKVAMLAFINSTTSIMKKVNLETQASDKVCNTQLGKAATTAKCCSSASRRMTVFYTPVFKKHRPPPGVHHPECPERLDACVDALKQSSELSELVDWVTPKGIDEKENSARRKLVLEAVRDVHRFPDYLERLEEISKKGGALDMDSYVAPGSFEVALLAASAWMEAVDVVLEGKKVAWALTRPPGHHATPASGMGFCLLSNAAIAAKYALKHEDVNSVAILDYDVHHGNGTEALVKDVENIRFASSHQSPLYPGSGPEGESGRYGNILNINLKEGTGLQTYQTRLEEEMLPFLLQSELGMPDLIIVSAGFDALDVDPLAQLDFKPSDYRLFTRILLKASGKDTKVVFGLEGGYDLGEMGLGAAVRESIAGYCIREPSEIPELADAS